MRAFLIVLDGVGIGALPDADTYGDVGTDTLRHVAEAVGGLRLPTLEQLGLGRIHDVPGVRRVSDPRAAHGRMIERSAGKDSTTGHWELAGVVLERPFPTYPAGFPPALLDRLSERTQKDGDVIVYTSADSVLQIAAHEDTVPLPELYAICASARSLMTGEHAVGRVIARPFVGDPGSYRRTAHRKDFSLAPPSETVLDRLTAAGWPVITVGKVDDLFAGRGVTEAIHTNDNSGGEDALAGLARAPGHGLVFANLVDFDQAYGHRNDPAGFAAALEQFDDRLAEILGHLRNDEMCLVTADHGNDPTMPGTDHAREYVPLLVTGPRVRPAGLGTRSTFADVGATLARMFEIPAPASGTSFLAEVRG